MLDGIVDLYAKALIILMLASAAVGIGIWKLTAFLFHHIHIYWK